MIVSSLAEIEPAWQKLAPFLALSNHKRYRAALKLLGQLMNAVDERGDHPLGDLMEKVADSIAAYERRKVEMGTTPQEVLRFLMEEHGLNQSNLPEIGSQGVVSEILSGKRKLNLRQIKALAKRFGVSPATFLD